MGELFWMFYKEKKNPVQYIFYFAQSAQLVSGVCCASKATEGQAGGSQPVIRILGSPLKGRMEEVLRARVASLIDSRRLSILHSFWALGSQKKSTDEPGNCCARRDGNCWWSFFLDMRHGAGAGQRIAGMQCGFCRETEGEMERVVSGNSEGKGSLNPVFFGSRAQWRGGLSYMCDSTSCPAEPFQVQAPQ
jgi:hypothetical protein